MPDNIQNALNEYSDEKRLAVYKMITAACQHLFSKGKLQEAKFIETAKVFADLAIHDPIFMVHFAAWAAKKDSKDQQVLSIFFNALNDANGTPFVKGGTLCKPNFREISYALLQNLDPKMALRVLELCHKKFEVPGILNKARHFPTGMKTAFRKYLLIREDNEEGLRGVKKAGLSRKMQQLYRLTRTAPSDVAASILGWKQKDGRDLSLEKLPDFSKMTSVKIAETLEETKLSPLVVMSLVPKDKMTARVAKAIMSNCNGNQVIVLYNFFNRNGFLEVKSIKELFKDKVKTATTTVDRIDTLTKTADEKDKAEMAEVRSARRKEVSNTSGIGKIYMHIDSSGSMNQAIDFAKEKASVIAECVTDPDKNFRWGHFGTVGVELPVPKSFTKEHFHQALYGVRAMGQTDCIALYKEARRFGADVDVYVTDQGHNIGNMVDRITSFHRDNPNIPMPKAAVIVDYSYLRNAVVKDELVTAMKRVGIPVAILTPDSLKESALVGQSIRAAMIGELATINEIMETPLPKLPHWWGSINQKKVVEVENEMA